MMKRIVLASKSPRRSELLKLIYPNFEIIPSDKEELPDRDASVYELPAILSKQKTLDVAANNPDALIIGADTIVVIGNKVMGKPKDTEDAYAMLSSLSGNSHSVVTGVTIYFNGKTKTFSEITEVYFNKLTEDEIMEYIRTGEPMDKAGGYGIQGKGALLVKRISGDFFNVMGLPVSRLANELKDFNNS